MRRETLLRLHAVVEDTARALEAIEKDDDLNRERGGRALREAFARVERMMEEVRAAVDLDADDAWELAGVVVELVRVAVRAQGAAWKAARDG